MEAKRKAHPHSPPVVQLDAHVSPLVSVPSRLSFACRRVPQILVHFPCPSGAFGKCPEDSCQVQVGDVERYLVFLAQDFFEEITVSFSLLLECWILDFLSRGPYPSLTRSS